MIALQPQAIPVIKPRFGTPGDAALFVGSDRHYDYFFYPLSLCAVARCAGNEMLVTQHEDNPGSRHLYDHVHALFEHTAAGEVIA